MPSRILREGLLDSPRYWGARLEARDFFIRLLLVADDFGCVSLAPVFIGRRCFNIRPGEAKLEKLYAELCRVDLLRIYFSGSSAELPDRFGFIPRFRQTLRQMKARHPMPPPSLYEDDYDAAAKFMQFKQLFAKMPSTRTTAALQVRRECSADLGLDLGLGVDLETNPKRNDLDLGSPPFPPSGGTPTSKNDVCASSKPVLQNEGQKVKGNGQDQGKTVLQGNTLKTWAAAQGIHRAPGESESDYAKRATNAYLQAKQTAANA
jgi:hypothetical protein